MAERHAVVTLVRSGGGLTEGIVVGLHDRRDLFIKRMADVAGVEAEPPLVPEDKADSAGVRTVYDGQPATDPDIIVYRIRGALFFGAASSVGMLLEEAPTRYRALVMDFTGVPFADATGINMIAGVCRTALRGGAKIFLTGTERDLRDELTSHGVRPPDVVFSERIEDAVALLRQRA